jgi:hypothetical protein
MKMVNLCAEQIDCENEKTILNFTQHLMSNSKWIRLINKLYNVEYIDKKQNGI